MKSMSSNYGEQNLMIETIRMDGHSLFVCRPVLQLLHDGAGIRKWRQLFWLASTQIMQIRLVCYSTDLEN